MAKAKGQLRFKQIGGGVQKESQDVEFQSETFLWARMGLNNKWRRICQVCQVVLIHDNSLEYY